MEVNCETDFVARGNVFKGLCSDLAMQIAAFGDVVAVSADHIPQEVLDKERDIEMGKDDILSKPEDKRCGAPLAAADKPETQPAQRPLRLDGILRCLSVAWLLAGQ